jgi:hypothetical protein
MADLDLFLAEDISLSDVLDLPGQAGAAEVGQVRLVCGPHAITVDRPQWGFSKDVYYREQIEGVTPYGIFHRHAQGIAMRGYTQLRFPRVDATIEAFRALSHYAGRTGERVYVVLDLGEASIWWWVDWQPMIGFKRILENREEIVLSLQRQSEGL